MSWVLSPWLEACPTCPGLQRHRWRMFGVAFSEFCSRLPGVADMRMKNINCCRNRAGQRSMVALLVDAVPLVAK